GPSHGTLEGRPELEVPIPAGTTELERRPSEQALLAAAGRLRSRGTGPGGALAVTSRRERSARTTARALRVTSGSRGSPARGEGRDGRIHESSAAARGGGPPVRPRLRLLPQPGGGVSRAPPSDQGGVPAGRKGLPH